MERGWSHLAGQDIVTRTGRAFGNVGVEAAAKAAPDGYTLLLGNAGAMAINLNLQALHRPLRDFVPITQIADLPSALVAHPSFPPKSAKELIAYVKPMPGKFSFASPGPGSTDRLEMERFMKASGIRMVHRPYKSGPGPAIVGLLAGETSVMFVPLATVASEIRGGKLKLLAVAATRRVGGFPNTPTLAEQGVAQMASGAWQGVFAPKGTPPQIVAKLHTMLQQVMVAPWVNFLLNGAGINVVTSESPQAFAAFLRAETERWAQVVKESGARRNDRARFDSPIPRQWASLAARSNTWARDDPALRAENWRLIARARETRGDQQGAMVAREAAARQR
jgi:tripartite-type tricarboxylate transporter receptor subunit TctC